MRSELGATLGKYKVHVSINLSAFDERKEQMGIRRPTKRVGVPSYSTKRAVSTGTCTCTYLGT